MNRRTLLAAILALPVAANPQSFSDIVAAVKDPLIAMLTSKLGISENQATGGVGSVLTLAKEKLSAGDFSKLTTAIPSASKYIDSAKQSGAVTGPLKNSKGLNGALSKLGMSTVTDYVGKIGGDSAKNILTAALK